VTGVPRYILNGGSRTRTAALSGIDALTGQERRVLELIGEGLTNRQIGRRLFIGEKTVKSYTSSIFGKLGVECRTQAAVYAIRNGGNRCDRCRAGAP
jgi:two-component system response regulator DevR